MPKPKVTTNPNIEEPSSEMAEVFEFREDRERRVWSENGCDWGYFIVRFLQGQRRAEITPEEITQTKLYARCDELERRALEMVCANPNPLVNVTPDDECRLRERDSWLVDFVDRKTLGHQDWIEQLLSIPAAAAERQTFDSAYFFTQYPQPRLFAWIFNPRPGGKPR